MMSTISRRTWSIRAGGVLVFAALAAGLASAAALETGDGHPSAVQRAAEYETSHTAPIGTTRSEAQTSVRIYSTDGTIQWAG